MKKALVSGYIGFNNFGDEAVFYVLSNHLKNLNMEVSAICNNPDVVKEKYEVETVCYKKIFSIIKAIFKTNILISGGGSLLQNKTSNKSLYYYLFILITAKIFNKKTMIFAQGIEPVKGKINELILKNTLKTADFISVRDKNSLNYLEKMKIKGILTTDPVYRLLQDKKINKNKDGLIIQLRQYSRMDDNLLQILAKSISKNFKEKIKIISFEDKFDKEICEKFQKYLSNYNLNSEIILQKPIDETIEIINNSKFMISTRLHGAISAHALKTKIFTLNYDEKLKTLCQELNISNIDIFNYTNKEFEEKIDNFFKNKNENETKYRKFRWDEVDMFLKG